MQKKLWLSLTFMLLAGSYLKAQENKNQNEPLNEFTEGFMSGIKERIVQIQKIKEHVPAIGEAPRGSLVWVCRAMCGDSGLSSNKTKLGPMVTVGATRESAFAAIMRSCPGATLYLHVENTSGGGLGLVGWTDNVTSDKAQQTCFQEVVR